ncbi:MAG: hypothetical protein AB1664_16325 [Thermodesulfobacteriota bacterium]
MGFNAYTAVMKRALSMLVLLLLVACGSCAPLRDTFLADLGIFDPSGPSPSGRRVPLPPTVEDFGHTPDESPPPRSIPNPIAE